jgi:hypothetical protein
MLSRAYEGRVAYYKHGLGLPAAEAVARAEEPCPPSRIREIEGLPPDKVTWDHLEELNRNGPEWALSHLDDVRRAARERLRSGQLAACCVEGDRSSPWQRLLFLALRDELADGWQPRNGIERQLIDLMAQAQMNLFAWQRRLAASETAEVEGAMVERFHRIFTRTLRSLQDRRKTPLAVFVGNPKQVNVAAQQLVAQNGNGRARRKVKQLRGRAGPCTCPADRRSLFAGGG